MKQPIRRFRPKGQAGFALIEVLVAVLILAIGLLGVASLQTTSIEMNGQSRQKSQALLLGQDMVERIRVNARNAGDYDLDLDPGLDCDPALNPTSASVADRDIAEWSNDLACLLAGGSATVDVDTANNTVTVTVGWDSRDEENERDSLTLQALYQSIL